MQRTMRVDHLLPFSGLASKYCIVIARTPHQALQTPLTNVFKKSRRDVFDCRLENRNRPIFLLNVRPIWYLDLGLNSYLFDAIFNQLRQFLHKFFVSSACDIIILENADAEQ